MSDLGVSLVIKIKVVQYVSTSAKKRIIVPFKDSKKSNLMEFLDSVDLIWLILQTYSC